MHSLPGQTPKRNPIMPRDTTLLPVSSTQLEIDLLDTFIESVAAKIGNPIEVQHLWNPDTCPVAFLQYLATAFSVDGDTAAYSETQLRNLIKISVNLHHIKGTLGSVIDIISALGYSVHEIIEGDRDTNNAVIRTDGRWAHFTVSINEPIPIQSAYAAVTLIEAIAPVSRKLTLFTYTHAPHRWDGNPDPEGNLRLFFNGLYTFGQVSTETINR